MYELASGPVSESAIVAAYDKRRRLGLVRIIAPAFAVLLAMFISVLTIYVTQGGIPESRIGQALSIDGLLVLCLGLFIEATITSRRGQMSLATGSTIVATDLVIISFNVFWSFVLGNGLDPVVLAVFSSIAITIVLAGTLGETWMILITILIANALTIILLGFATPIIHSLPMMQASNSWSIVKNLFLAPRSLS